MTQPFANRRAAGVALAQSLDDYRNTADLLVLALPRGGVPVAFEVASALNATLDVMLVRKLGVPIQPELAMGAIASGGICVFNDQVLKLVGLNQAQLDAVIERERQELQRREQAYRGERPAPAIRDRTVILIDDGIATGSSMKAAIQALQSQRPARLVVAVPVAPAQTVAEFQKLVDDFVCPLAPVNFSAVGQWYVDFDQTSDSEVRELLARQAQGRAN